MRRTELLPNDEQAVTAIAAFLFPGSWNLVRPYGAELLRRVVRKNSVRYRQDVSRAQFLW